MRSLDELRRRLLELDRTGYRGYRSIEGEYRLPHLTLFIDHVQSDPFAPPSRLRARMPLDEAGYPAQLLSSPCRRVAVADFLARRFASVIHRLSAHDLRIDADGQTVLERTAAEVRDRVVELRFTARLPAAGRTILGHQAAHLLTDQLPRALSETLTYGSLDAEALERHANTVEDAEALRDQLAPHGLVAFVADGAILPRLSGASDLPLRDRVIVFESALEMRVTLHTPHAGVVTGMGIPEGVTLIVGGGYHGKTTLLQAIQVGIYNHVPGDGRERVVTLPDAVKVRSEDGRRIEKVDISPFLSNLPFGTDTSRFSTDDASGSTSQAAGIMETLEIGSRLLLLDEDTSATNFMVRDDLMQQLVPKDLEPITPFIDRVRELAGRGISTIHVTGGHGDYFEVADHVIMMEGYRPRVVTERAKEIAAGRANRRRRETVTPFHPPIARIPLPQSLDAETGRGRTKVSARDIDEIRFGREEIELWTIDQLVDTSQTRAIGAALLYLVSRGYIDGRRPLAAALDLLESDIAHHGLGVISSFRFDAPPGDLARPRRHETGAALNRLRSLKVQQER